MHRIFWVDEEETVAYPDIMHLKYKGYSVDLVGSAGEALDWFNINRKYIGDFCCFVIDVQLPINGDPRFKDQIPSRGAFTGLKLCELLKTLLTEQEWQLVKSKMLLYTRLPDTPRMARIKSFASENGLIFVDKSGNVNIAVKLSEYNFI